MFKWKSYLIYTLKGMMMGAADVIPGVSGGTIAFITGIYQKLIESLNEIDLTAVKQLITFKWIALESKINGFFLFSLVLGVFISVFSLAKLIQFLLEVYPEAIWAFFFGLIIASAMTIHKHLERKWALKNFLWFVFGTVIAYLLTTSDVIHTPNTHIYIFCAGILSIIAMILPGISGSYLLVIINKYKFIIDITASIGVSLKNIIIGVFTGNFEFVSKSWSSMDLHTLLIFEAGTLTGVIGFSKVLNWLFKKFYDSTLSILTGFMVGSLNKVWPWKETIPSIVDKHGKLIPLQEKNILPASYDSYFVVAIALAIGGFIFVCILERFSNKKK